MCSVILAWHLHRLGGGDAIPLLNFPREDLQLKTEVLKCFGDLGLPLADLPYASEMAELLRNFPGTLSVALVDHNVIRSVKRRHGSFQFI